MKKLGFRKVKENTHLNRRRILSVPKLLSLLPYPAALLCVLVP